MSARVAVILGLGLLSACGLPVRDPLAVHSVYWGLAPMPEPPDELPLVLYSAEDTPAKQGLLYTAMHEAEVAAQYAGRAAAAEGPDLARSALGEVLYAIDPELAPPWEAKDAGIVAGWAGGGYGVRRAAAEMAAEILSAADDEEASAALAEYGPPAAACAENTLGRAERLVALSGEALAAEGAAAEALHQIHELAIALNQGAAAEVRIAPDADPACGLQETERYLDLVAPRES